MKPSLLIADFTGMYEAEGFLQALQDRGVPYRQVRLGDIEGTCCYCSPEAEAEIMDRLVPQPEGRVRWIDSGDYHYVTKILAARERESFTLVLVDNHPDDQAPVFGGVLSCGSWVTQVHRLPNWREEAPNVYISIDKDVLSRVFARTDWDQGTMTLDELSAALRKLRAERRIIGVDLCGGNTIEKGASPEDLALNASTGEALYGLFRD